METQSNSLGLVLVISGPVLVALIGLLVLVARQFARRRRPPDR